jgi:hypothetical protein
MKSFKLALLALFINVSVFSQQYSIVKGTGFTPPDASKWGGFAGENDDSFFILRIKTRGKGTTYYIESISKKTREKQFEVELPLEKEADVALDPVYLDMRLFCANQRIFVFFKGQSKSDKNVKYFMKTVFADGKLGDMVEILNTAEKVDLNFYQSPDKTKILILQDNPWVEQRQMSEAILYEASTFKKVWSKKLPSEYKSSVMESYFYNLDNQGNLYFLFNYLEDADAKKIGTGIGVLSDKAEKAKMLPLPNKNNYTIENGRAKVTSDGKLVFTGLYKFSVKKDEQRYKELSKKERVAYDKELDAQKEIGFFSYYFDKDAFTVSADFKKFPEEVAKKLEYAGGLLTFGAANKYYSASGLVEVQGEFYMIENHKYTISGDGIATYEREFIISKIGKKGQILWTKIYPKSTVNKLNTFNILVKGDKMYLFYLEHPKNLENSTVETYNELKYENIGNYNGSVMVALEVSSDGSAKRDKVFENKGWCYDPQPFNILLEGENSLLLRMINKDQERFDVLKVD